jgi:hypothetical protein
LSESCPEPFPVVFDQRPLHDHRRYVGRFPRRLRQQLLGGVPGLPETMKPAK